MSIPEWGKKNFNSELRIAQAELYGFLSKTISERRVDTIAIESPYVDPERLSNVERAYFMRGVVFLALGLRPGIRFIDLSSREWRKHFLGVVRAPKEIPASQRRAWLKKEARKKCIERGWFVKSDDEAEALGVLDCARAMLNPNHGTSTTPLFAEAL